MRFTAAIMSSMVVIVAIASFPGADEPKPPPDKPTPLTAEQKDKLKERDRLKAEVEKLQNEGKLAAAVITCEEKLAIERDVFGDLHDDVVASLSQLAALHDEREDWPAAKRQRDETLRIQTKRFGEQDWRTGDARRALEDGERFALMPAEDRLDIVEGLRLMAEVDRLRLDGTSRQAIEPCRLAVVIWMKVLGPEHFNVAASLNNLGLLLAEEADYVGARRHLERALDITLKVLGPEHPKTATNLKNLGYVLQAHGHYTGARAYYEQALAISKKSAGPEHRDTAHSLNYLGALLLAQGEYAAARQYLEQALAISKKSVGPEHPDIANTLNSLGLLLSTQGDHAGARPYHEQALAISKKALGEKHRDTATSLNNLGHVLVQQADYIGARRHYTQALAAMREIRGADHPDTALSLTCLGHVFLMQGDYEGALPCFTQALAIFEKSLGPEHAFTAQTFYYIGYIHCARADYASALAFFEKGIAVLEKTLGAEHGTTATCYNALGRLFQAQGAYGRAKCFLEKALAVTSRSTDLAADGLSERQQLAMADALRFHLDCYLSVAAGANVSSVDAYGPLLHSKGAVLSRQHRLRLGRQQPELRKTWENFQSASSRVSTFSFVAPEPKGRDIWRRQLDEATREKEDLEVKLMRESAAFRRQKELQRLTPEQLQKALPAGAALIDFLEYRHSTPPPEGKGKMKFERHLVAFVVRPDQPIVRVDLGPAAPITTAIEVWRKTFGRADAALGAGLLTPPSDRPQVSGARETFGPSAGHGQETVRQREVPQREAPQRDGTPAAELRRFLWEPLETHLKDAKVVLISPDGVLNQLPFAAIPGKEPGTYLIEERAVAVIPVPQLLPDLIGDNPRNLRLNQEPNADFADDRRAEKQGPSMLLVGDVDYDGDPGKPVTLADSRKLGADTRAGPFKAWQGLSGTRTEIATIRDSFEQRFADGKITVLRKDKATEAAVREHGPRHRYLHLATHGFFAPKEMKSALAPAKDEKFAAGDLFQHQSVTGWHPGLLSGLVLAGANQKSEPERDDGILTAIEVAPLDLSSVELAVLSACETGLGEVAGGEGILGLQRAFQTAGAKSVVATLWQVRDDAARLLMIDFYDNLLRKKMSKAEALRQAQLTMLRDGANRGLGGDEVKDKRLPPYYWAGFVLSGDWR